MSQTKHNIGTGPTTATGQTRASWLRKLLPGMILAALTSGSIAWSTSFREPPRFDGAGYALLAQSLLSGQGYRSIDHPDRPKHVNFPPGYPVVLAGLWSITGRSATAAHWLSLACTTAAVLLAWRWFRTLYRPRVAFLLSLALAMNWTWQRTGGSIQSEPLFLLGQQLALLMAVAVRRWGGLVRGLGLGLLLAVCLLTRQVGVVLVAVILFDLGLARRWGASLATALFLIVLLAPWIFWQMTAGGKTQAEWLPADRLGEVLVGNVVFYIARLPDALSGPFVEVATIFRPLAARPAMLMAALTTMVLLTGAVLTLQSPRRRLAGVLVFGTLALLLIWPFTEAGRFLVPLVPALLISGVEGLSRIFRKFGLRRAREAGAAFLLLVAIPYTTYALVTNRDRAQNRQQIALDNACLWLAENAERPGPILSAYPGEIHWFTSREGLAPAALDGPVEVDQMIKTYNVDYIVLTADRFAKSPNDPLRQYIKTMPERVERVYGDKDGQVQVFAIQPASKPESIDLRRAPEPTCFAIGT